METNLVTLDPDVLAAFPDSRSVNEALRSLIPGPTYSEEDVDQALSDARRLAEEGRYEEALERHLWYHHNANIFGVGQGGVRLSFALHNWIELGEKYPPALDALRAVRDQALAKLRQNPGDHEQFSDAMNINLALPDYESAKVLFYEALEQGIHEPISVLSLKDILATGDLEWARDIVGDPHQRLDNLLDEHEMHRITEKLFGNEQTKNKEMKKMMREFRRSQLVNLIRAVAKTHGLEEAAAIQTKVLRRHKSAEIRNALNAQ